MNSTTPEIAIITVLSSVTKRQIEAGAEVTVFYLERPEGPTPEQPPTYFDDQVELRSFTGGASKIKDYRMRRSETSSRPLPASGPGDDPLRRDLRRGARL
jgi:hypothetical protein